MKFEAKIAKEIVATIAAKFAMKFVAAIIYSSGPWNSFVPSTTKTKTEFEKML